MKTDVKPNNVSGIIMPHNWDETGKVIGIAIYTSNEDVYLVEHNSLEPDLLLLINKKAEVKGRIRERLDGKKTIAVHSYSISDEKAGKMDDRLA